MIFRAGWRDPCTWNFARLLESVKIHSPAARAFLRLPKLSQHPVLNSAPAASCSIQNFSFIVQSARACICKQNTHNSL